MSNTHKIFACVTVALLNLALCTVAVGQAKATAQEGVAKVKEAASTLSKTGDAAQFNQKQSPWVWKGTYIFVEDCDRKVMAAHPMHPGWSASKIHAVSYVRSSRTIPNQDLVIRCRASKQWHHHP